MGERQLFFSLKFRTGQSSKGSTHTRVDVPHSFRPRGSNAEDSTPPRGRAPTHSRAFCGWGQQGAPQQNPAGEALLELVQRNQRRPKAEGESTERESVGGGALRSTQVLSGLISQSQDEEKAQLHKHQEKN